MFDVPLYTHYYSKALTIDHPACYKTRYRARYRHVGCPDNYLVNLIGPCEEPVWLAFPLLGTVSLQGVEIELKKSAHRLHKKESLSL